MLVCVVTLHVKQFPQRNMLRNDYKENWGVDRGKIKVRLLVIIWLLHSSTLFLNWKKDYFDELVTLSSLRLYILIENIEMTKRVKMHNLLFLSKCGDCDSEQKLGAAFRNRKYWKLGEWYHFIIMLSVPNEINRRCMARNKWRVLKYCVRVG